MVFLRYSRYLSLARLAELSCTGPRYLFLGWSAEWSFSRCFFRDGYCFRRHKRVRARHRSPVVPTTIDENQKQFRGVAGKRNARVQAWVQACNSRLHLGGGDSKIGRPQLTPSDAIVTGENRRRPNNRPQIRRPAGYCQGPRTVSRRREAVNLVALNSLL